MSKVTNYIVKSTNVNFVERYVLPEFRERMNKLYEKMEKLEYAPLLVVGRDGMWLNDDLYFVLDRMSDGDCWKDNELGRWADDIIENPLREGEVREIHFNGHTYTVTADCTDLSNDGYMTNDCEPIKATLTCEVTDTRVYFLKDECGNDLNNGGYFGTIEEADSFANENGYKIEPDDDLAFEWNTYMIAKNNIETFTYTIFSGTKKERKLNGCRFVGAKYKNGNRCLLIGHPEYGIVATCSLNNWCELPPDILCINNLDENEGMDKLLIDQGVVQTKVESYKKFNGGDIPVMKLTEKGVKIFENIKEYK